MVVGGMVLPVPVHLLNCRKKKQLLLLGGRAYSMSLKSKTLRLPQAAPDSAAATHQEAKAQSLASRFWKVASPYWYSEEDKVQARLRLLAVFLLTLGTTGISVGFNFLGRDFYNALANKDQEEFSKQLLYYLAGFAGGIPFFVLRDYARDTLALRWRSWMTTYYMQRYLKKQAFYKIQSQSIIDNPDQRIVDDLNSFTSTALSFSLILFNAAVDLISFSNILYGIYPPLFVVLILYSVSGTAISVFLGKGLVTLNFLQEKKEADFRYGLVRIRENAESIAFYGGEENEMQLLLRRFATAFDNLTKLLIASRNLDFFTSGYRYLIQVLPVAVVAPMYFSGKIEFGVINQSVSAFNHILGDFSLVVYQFQAISAFSAIINRLGEFDEVLDGQNVKSEYEFTGSIQLHFYKMGSNAELENNGSLSLDKHVKLLGIQHLTLQTPTSGTTLIRDLTLEIYENNHLLVTGPSGSGKTSLLRAIAGLWNYGDGEISFYTRDAYEDSTSAPLEGEGKLERLSSRSSRNVFFLPQKPYMVLGTLRQQLLYPNWTQDSASIIGGAEMEDSLSFLNQVPRIKYDTVRPKKPSTEDLTQALEDVRLGYLLSRSDGLDSMNEWSSMLSLGEQQRLAFARLLLSKPKLALLDEATSALDEANEANLYRQIEAAGITYVSIGHRRTLYNHHTRILHISAIQPLGTESNWYIEPINQQKAADLSQP